MAAASPPGALNKINDPRPSLADHWAVDGSVFGVDYAPLVAVIIRSRRRVIDSRPGRDSFISITVTSNEEGRLGRTRPCVYVCVFGTGGLVGVRNPGTGVIG